jgi:Phage protein Gp138 N-terminal domain
MISELVESLQLMIESSLSDINTSTPGEIVSYNAATNRAVVRPSLPKKLDNGDVLTAPNIVEVPVQFHGSNAGGASFTFPLKPGDPVNLSFQQRSMEGYLKGSKDAPDDPRQFDLSDCVAIPGGGASGIVGHADNVVLKFGNANVTLHPDGMIVLGNGGGSITIDSGGNMTLKAASIQIDAGGKQFNLEHHKHKDTQPGGGLSGEPNP